MTVRKNRRQNFRDENEPVFRVVPYRYADTDGRKNRLPLITPAYEMGKAHLRISPRLLAMRADNSVHPVSGEKLQALAREVMTEPAEVIARMNAVLKD